MHTQFKTDSALVFTSVSPLDRLTLFFPAPSYRQGMRDDRIIDLRNIRRTKPSVLYSSAPKEPISTPPTPATANPTMASGSLIQRRQLGMHSKCPSESFVCGRTRPASLDLAIDDSVGSLLLYSPSTDTRVGTFPVDPKNGSDLAQGRSDLACPPLPELLKTPQLQVKSRIILLGSKAKSRLRRQRSMP